MAHDVFISHSSEDKVVANRIYKILKDRNIRCWIAPESIPPGSNYGEAIIDAINNCQIMVMVFSSHSNVSKYVQMEVERAVSKGVTIIPFRIEDVKISNQMELFLSSTQWLDALSAPLEKHIEQLAKTIRSMLSKNQSSAENTENIIERSYESNINKQKKGWVWSAGCIIIVALFVSVYFGLFANKISDLEQATLASYLSGDYSTAGKNASILMEKKPERGLSYLILGNIRFMDGDLKSAESFYKKGISVGNATDDQKAEILMGLGRIASINGNHTEAMDYYNNSSDKLSDPDQAFLSQAILLDRNGEYDKALNMINKTGKTSQTDPAYRAIANEIKKRASFKNDMEKQQEIDALVKELSARMKDAKSPVPQNNLRSQPLTIWMMDFETTGYSLKEGNEQLIGACIINTIINKSPVRIVERNLLDSVLRELNLGSSNLADQSTALTLGKLMSARLIVSGKIHYMGATTQVTLRIIETETGEIRGAINEEFNSRASSSQIADKLATRLLKLDIFDSILKG